MTSRRKHFSALAKRRGASWRGQIIRAVATDALKDVDRLAYLRRVSLYRFVVVVVVIVDAELRMREGSDSSDLLQVERSQGLTPTRGEAGKGGESLTP